MQFPTLILALLSELTLQVCQRLPTNFSLTSISQHSAEHIHTRACLAACAWMGTIAGPATWKVKTLRRAQVTFSIRWATLVLPVSISRKMKANLWQNLQPKLWSHKRWLTRGRLLLMNKVSVLRFREHLLSSVLFCPISYLTFMGLSSSTRSSDGAGRHGEGTRTCSVRWLLVYSFEFSFEEKFSFPRLKAAVNMRHMRGYLTTKTRWILNSAKEKDKISWCFQFSPAEPNAE